MNDVIQALLDAGTFSHKGKTYPIAHCTSAAICRQYADLIVTQHLTRGLEIGTLFGFSTLFLADAFAQTGGTLDTIDIRYKTRIWTNGEEIEDIHEVAERLITKACLDDCVAFHAGNSNTVLAELIQAQAVRVCVD